MSPCSPEDNVGACNLVAAFEQEEEEDDNEDEEEQGIETGVTDEIIELNFDEDAELSAQADLLLNCTEPLAESHQSAQRSKSALKHFTVFIQKFYNTKKEHRNRPALNELICESRDRRPMTVGNRSTKTGTLVNDKRTYNPNARTTQWFNEMFNHFCQYLVKAHKYRNESKPFLSHQAASNYLSDVKVWFLKSNPHVSVSDVPCLDPLRWKALRKQMLGNIIVRCRLDGTRVHNGHKPATREDRKAMALACVWMASPEGAEFFHLNNATYHFAGRGSECSLIQKKDASTGQVTEGNKEYDTLHVFLKRHKTHKEQDMSIFVHKRHWHQCFLFSLMFLILVKLDREPHMLPTFAEKANAKNGKGQTVSKVASHWSSLYKKLLSLFEGLQDLAICTAALSAGLSSHSQKKGANQDMSGILSVSGLAQIFRSGWQVRGIHSLLEYVVGDQVMQDQAGKALSGWTTSYGNHVIGGEPPNLEDVSTQHDQLIEFVKLCFSHDTDNWSWPVQKMLMANFIRFYDAFLDDLKVHPKFADPSAHPLVQHIQDQLDAAHVSPETFEAWKKEIDAGFRIRNAMALPLTMLNEQQRNSNSIDLRSLADSLNSFHQHMDDAQEMQRATHESIVQLKRENFELKKKLNHTKRQNGDTQTELQKNRFLLEKITAQNSQLLQILMSGNSNPTLTPSPPRQSRRSVHLTPDTENAFPEDEDQLEDLDPSFLSQDHAPPSTGSFLHLIRNSKIPSDVLPNFSYFFKMDLQNRYQNDINSEAWKGVLQKERKSAAGYMSRAKSNVKFMLLFTQKSPSQMPRSSKNKSLWHTKIDSIQADAKQLWIDTFPANYKMTNQTIIDQSKILLDNGSTLPEETPEFLAEYLKDALTSKKKRKASPPNAA